MSCNLGAQFYECAKCRVNINGEDAQIRVEHEQVAKFSVSTSLIVEKTQNIRLKLSLVDFIADVIPDPSYEPKLKFNISLQETDYHFRSGVNSCL